MADTDTRMWYQHTCCYLYVWYTDTTSSCQHAFCYTHVIVVPEPAASTRSPIYVCQNWDIHTSQLNIDIKLLCDFSTSELAAEQMNYIRGPQTSSIRHAHCLWQEGWIWTWETHLKSFEYAFRSIALYACISPRTAAISDRIALSLGASKRACRRSAMLLS